MDTDLLLFMMFFLFCICAFERGHRYCPKEHGLLWSSFAESLVSSWQLITATLSRDFDVLPLLMPLLTELFARVQASMLVPMAAASNRSNAPTPSASYANFLELGEVGAGPAAVPEVGIHYQPVYVDLLLVLAEQLVTVTRSGIAVSFLQSVWKWLQAFTSVRQHKQQAATQLKRDLRSKQLAPAGLGFGAGSSLLFPSNLAAIAPLATAAVESSGDEHVSHESHADKALLESIARVTVQAQSHQHLHSVAAPEVAGTSAVEAVRVMQNLYTAGMWYLVDNVRCFRLYLVTSLNYFTVLFLHPIFGTGDALLCSPSLACKWLTGLNCKHRLRFAHLCDPDGGEDPLRGCDPERAAERAQQRCPRPGKAQLAGAAPRREGRSGLPARRRKHHLERGVQ